MKLNIENRTKLKVEKTHVLRHNGLEGFQLALADWVLEFQFPHSVVRVAHDVPQLLLHLVLASAVAWDSSYIPIGSRARERGIRVFMSGEVIHGVRRLWLKHPSIKLTCQVSCVLHTHLLLSARRISCRCRQWIFF